VDGWRGALEGVVEEVISQGWNIYTWLVLVLCERHRGFDGVVTDWDWVDAINNRWTAVRHCAGRLFDGVF
jgi:uncharacterized protein (DUF2461 family)